MSPTPPNPGRRADLDWIRITALALLILYHVTLVYTPWDWHINSIHKFKWLEEAILITSPWRLTLLFLVSGAALRLMSRKLTAEAVLKARFARLGPPFLFGVLVLVPPQAWLEALAKGWWSGGFWGWFARDYSPAGILDGIPINHLWFVLYIAVYSLVAVALLFAPGAMARIEAGLAKALSGWRLLVVPMLYLAAIRILLFPWFGISNNLPVDWYNHALSLGMFLFGFLLVGHDEVWRTLEARRWLTAPLALVFMAVLMSLYLFRDDSLAGAWTRYTVFAIYQWMTLCAVLGFCSRHLRDADGPVRRYLNEAIFPVYLAHQTVLVIAAFLITPLAWPVIAEAPVLIALTFGVSAVIYEIVRRIGPLRPLWGLRPLPRPAGAAA